MGDHEQPPPSEDKGTSGSPETREQAGSAKKERDPKEGGFRILLAAGAVVFAGLGLWGLLSADWLRSALRLDVPEDTPGFIAVARLYGGAMLALSVGYVLAAIHPQRNRGILVVCFVAPLIAGIAMIIAAARAEMAPVAGAVFGVVFIAYSLIYFRLYPKPLRTLLPTADAEAEPEAPKPRGPDEGGKPPA